MNCALSAAALVTVYVVGFVAWSAAAEAPPRPNILFITVDDMNHDTPGCFGGTVANITPNIDRLAREGRRFTRAHVAVAVCQPSRECMMTGSFPAVNGATGFYPVKPNVVTLQERLKEHGYQLGILGKVSHLKPAEKFPWDIQHDLHELGAGRDPERYYALTTEFIAQAKVSGRPFFLMANSHDPHRPWPGANRERELLGKQVARSASGQSEDARDAGEAPSFEIPTPSRVYSPDEVPVFGFLPDLPNVRKEVAQYYTGARRADLTVGRILDALRDSGLESNTIVVFLSDNGVSLPFAKSNCYLASTRTPLIIRWPGKIEPDSQDQTHFVSAVDLMPTLLEATALPLPDGMQGRSLLPILRGGTQPGRDHVFTCYNDTVTKTSYVMRCRQDARFGYIFNAWADGKKAYRSESMIGLTFEAMKTAAVNDPALAGRVEMLLHRAPEELYDLQNDPDALHNLIDDSQYRSEVEKIRRETLAWMKSLSDPAAADLEALIQRGSAVHHR